MRHTRTWLYFFLPFLYVSIIFGLIAVQFSKKSDSFSQSLGDLAISGKASQGGQPTEFVLRGHGLEFAFDATHVLVTEDADGKSTKIRPLSWAWKDGNLLVSFQQGVQLLFEKSDAGRTLLIHPVANDAAKRVARLRIPFGADSGTRLNLLPRGSYMEVVRDKTRMLASVDGAQDRIDLDRNFVLVAGPSGFRPARIDSLAHGVSPELAWLTLDNATDPAAAETALTRYWDRAYASWSSSSTFSSALVDAWGREALRRGDYPAAFTKIQALLVRNRQAWGYEAAAYLGNVVELTIQHRRAVEATSSRSQPEWGGQGRLWLDAGFYGPPGSAERVKSVLLSGDLPDDAAGLNGVLENLLALQAKQPSELVTARLQEVLKALQSHVIRREGELYLERDGLLDLRQGLILGRLWLSYSRSLASESYGEAGAQLVVSALSHLDSSGRLPEFLVTQDGKIVRGEGQTLPEAVYQAVFPSPMFESGLAAWGPSAFVRAPSVVVSQQITEAQARFSFRFPTGSAEHIVIAGVPAFDHITLHGIRWRTDPQFQSYTDGWYYSASTKTLYLKIKHREDLEEVIVHFQPEQ